MSKGEVLNLKEFINNVVNLLDKKEEIFSYVDASDLWFFAVDVKRDLRNLKNEAISLQREVELDIDELINSIDEVLEVINEFQRLVVGYSRPEDLIFEAVKSDELLNKLYKEFSAIRKGLKKVSNAISQVLDELLTVSHRPFMGRKSLEKSRVLEDVESAFRFYEERIQRHHGASYGILKQISNIARISELLKIFERDTRALHVARQLIARVDAGIWAKELLDILTGLQSVTAEPVSEFIKFNFENIMEENESTRNVSVDELFYRYPPFEPIAVKKDKTFSMGRHTVKIPISGLNCCSE